MKKQKTKQHENLSFTKEDLFEMYKHGISISQICGNEKLVMNVEYQQEQFALIYNRLVKYKKKSNSYLYLYDYKKKKPEIPTQNIAHGIFIKKA